MMRNNSRIKLTLTSNYSHTIFYYDGCREDQVFINNSWVTLSSADSCKINISAWHFERDKIDSGESEIISIDRVHTGGKHRMGIHFYLDEKEEREDYDKNKHKIIYSKEFIYKECEVDSDCEWREMILSCYPSSSKCVNNNCKVGCNIDTI